MKIALIVAMAENGVIGLNNTLPWHLPEDLKYFKKQTLGKPIIMGRKTFESIGKPLPGRTNIVITKNPHVNFPEGVVSVASVQEAIDVAKKVALTTSVDELMVIGGQQIYQLFMPLAQRLYLTKVHAVVTGDAYLDSIDINDWTLISEQRHEATTDNPYAYSFCILEKAA